MDGGEPERIGQQVLVQGAGEAGREPRPASCSRSPSSTRKCAVRTSALRRPILTRCSTTIASSREAAHRKAAAEPGRLLERRHQLPRRHLGHGDVGDRGEAVVGGAQQDAAQADDVARDREVDHLPPAVRQQLVGAGPAVLEDVGVCPTCRSWTSSVPAATVRWLCLELRQRRQLDRAQSQKPAQLAGERAIVNVQFPAAPAHTIPAGCGNRSASNKH